MWGLACEAERELGAPETSLAIHDVVRHDGRHGDPRSARRLPPPRSAPAASADRVPWPLQGMGMGMVRSSSTAPRAPLCPLAPPPAGAVEKSEV